MSLGLMEVDHRISLWIGGAHEPSNWVGLHPWCHRAGKTPEDLTIQAKVKRLIRGPRKAKRAIRGRNDLKPHPTLKRDFSGKVVPR